ncbi:MAG TPA: ThiF family adenylyltransferase [Symbiobacteriaceae bacterium]|nr:ThiF family adenylyltransferase [Symbiobacteriaceae bacterium]
MEKPRVKSVFPPLPQGDGIIRVGGFDYGLAAEITDDEQGHIWQLLQLMDGSRNRLQLALEMQRFDPEITPDDVDATIAALIDAGYVEDAAILPPSDLFSPAEVERYRRNFDFFNYFHMLPLTKYDLQARLKTARVTVLGIGGLGSYVALSLAAAGVGNLLLVDHDTVETSNLNRQVLYTARDVGTLKVEAAARRLAEVNPHITVTTLNMKVSSVADARTCFHGQDLLVCAADRPRIRIYDWINQAAILERVPWIRGANDGLTVNSFLHVPGETACFECGQRWAHEKWPWYGHVLHYVMETVGDRTVNPCISPVAGLIGHLTALEVIKFLTKIARPVMYGRKLVVDLQTLETHLTAEAIRLPDCPVCGTGAELREEERNGRVPSL